MENIKVRGIAVVLLCGLLTAGLVSSAFSGGAPEGGEGDTQAQGSSDLFIDVPANHWAYDEVKYCVDRGIFTGLPSGKFEGEAALSRYSAAALITRAIKYLQSNPDAIGQKDLEAMQDLLLKTSQKLQKTEQEISRLKSQQPGSDLDRKISQNQQEIAQLNQKLNQTQASTGNVTRLRNRTSANFIIGLTGLFVGIIAIALASMG